MCSRQCRTAHGLLKQKQRIQKQINVDETIQSIYKVPGCEVLCPYENNNRPRQHTRAVTLCTRTASALLSSVVELVPAADDVPFLNEVVVPLPKPEESEVDNEPFPNEVVVPITKPEALEVASNGVELCVVLPEKGKVVTGKPIVVGLAGMVMFGGGPDGMKTGQQVPFVHTEIGAATTPEQSAVK